MKVMAAFGALPATIDAWVLMRGRTAGSGRMLVLSSSDLRMSFEMCRCECVESSCCPALVPRGPSVSRSLKLMGTSSSHAAMSLLTVLVLSELWPWLSLPPARGSLPCAAWAWVPTTLNIPSQDNAAPGITVEGPMPGPEHVLPGSATHAPGSAPHVHWQPGHKSAQRARRPAEPA